MSEELRSEMNYYKKLALSVEEKLSRQRLTPEDSPDGLTSTSTPRVSRKSSKTSSKAEETLTDDETTLTKSTDLHKYLATPSDTSETSSETSKPRIPTSLDIVPFSLEPLKKSKSSSNIQNSHDEPKLVRQGSYTLETPSPLLLAHLESNRCDYVPTNNKSQKRDWRLGQKTWKFDNSKRQGINGSLDSLNTRLSDNGGKFLKRSVSSSEVKSRNFEVKNRNFEVKNRDKKSSKTQNFKLKGKQSEISNGNSNIEFPAQKVNSKNLGGKSQSFDCPLKKFESNSNIGGKIQKSDSEHSNIGGKIRTLESEHSNIGGEMQTLESENLKIGGKIQTLETKHLNIGGKIQKSEPQN